MISSQASMQAAQPMHWYCRPSRMSMPVGHTCTHMVQLMQSPSWVSSLLAFFLRAPRGSPHKEHGRQNEQRAPGSEANNAVPEWFDHVPVGTAAVDNREPLSERIAGDFGGTVQRSEPGVGHKVFGERGKERAEE